jgi:hypothetical protein
MAVGDDGHAVVYNGKLWLVPVAVDSSPLSSVSCVSSRFCAAVDVSNRLTSFNGSKWSKPGTYVKDTGILGWTSISCVSTTFCVAVDNYGHELFWGSKPPFTRLMDNNGGPLDAVSCSSVHFCEAVDAEGMVVEFASIGSKLLWSAPGRIAVHRLTSISCTASTFCMAVDDGGEFVTSFHGYWSGVQNSIPLGSITQVSCVGRDTCFAIDDGSLATLGSPTS